VVEVASTSGLSLVPNATWAVRGVVAVRERLVPLVHLPALLSDAEHRLARPIPVSWPPAGAGRSRSRLTRSMTWCGEEPEAVPPGWRLPWASGCCSLPCPVIPVLDSQVLASRLAGAQ